MIRRLWSGVRRTMRQSSWWITAQLQDPSGRRLELKNSLTYRRSTEHFSLSKRLRSALLTRQYLMRASRGSSIDRTFLL